MNRKALSAVMATLLLIDMITLVLNVQPAKASSTTIMVPDDYTTIQEAINNANERDMIKVAAGVYQECVAVDKRLTLIGEDKDKSIIDGAEMDDVIRVTSDEVTIRGFTIRNSGMAFFGIYLKCSDGNVISDNKIANSGYGIACSNSHNNIFTQNVISNCLVGIGLGSNSSLFRGNTISNNDHGVELNFAFHNNFFNNNFIDNNYQAYSEETESTNTWDDGGEGNYWSDYEERYPNAQELNDSGIWDTPYRIDDNNQDNYPLMEPWLPSPPIPEPDFEISVSPEKQSVGREQSAEYTITVTSINDFQSEVSLYVLASYADLGIEFYPSEVTPPPSGTIESTLTITTTGSTPLWTFEIEIWAAGEGIKRNDTIKLSVEISLEVPYQNQGITEWCAPTSLAMILHYYGEIFHNWDYAEEKQLGTSQGANLQELSSYISSNYPLLTPRLGWYMLPFGGSNEAILSDIRSNLTSGFPVMLSLGPWYLLPPYHAVVAVGFNETGLFVNDPSGALFNHEGYLNLNPTDPKYPESWVHAYVKWGDVVQFIRTVPAPSILAVQGIPRPLENYGTVYLTGLIGTTFHNPKYEKWWEKDYYCLYPNQGLIWNHTQHLHGKGEEDNIIHTKCSALEALLDVSNCRSTVQSFTLHFDILGPDGIVHSEPAKAITNLKGFAERSNVRIGPIDVTGILAKGVAYKLGIYLYDSDGDPVDYFKSQSFNWGNGVKTKLSEQQKHLHLHVYDEEGNHVGLNYATNQVELSIPGSYYHDDWNGTTIIVLPQIIDLTIVVDARFAEDPVESFNLTVTIMTDLEVFSENCSGNIMAGRNQTFRTQVSETGLELYMDVDVDVEPNTLNLRSNGEWITAYIELPESQNVEDIEVSTIMLNNTIPIDLDAPTQIGDYDVDGIADLMVKFDRASINEWLGAIDYSEETARRCSVTLAITGKVLYATFQGLDAIEVLHK